MPHFTALRLTTAASRAVAVCALLLVVVTALRIAVDNPIESVGFLYVVPISVAAVEFGWRGGLAAALAAIALTVFWAVLQQVPLGVVGYVVRAAMFAGVGVLVGVQAEQRRSLLGERQRLIEELSATAMRDQLTGLANRRAWDERFAHELADARRTQASLSVGVVDIDGLKHANDTYGHAHGDALIQCFARALRSAVRETDFVARLGGDEFFIVLPDCSKNDAAELAERILAAVGPEHGYSIGIATWDGQESGPELAGRADAVMYDAKKAGVTRVHLQQR